VNTVRSMWLFKHKFHVDGTLSRYKACLVADGSSQQLGVDFVKTFSPVVKLATVCTVFSLVVSRKWPIHQLDVKNAFLNGDLSETVYMHQPLGFVNNRYPHHVCLLHRSLYALKQAPRAWFQRFTGYATRAGFYHSRSSCPTLLQQIIGSLNNEFDMTDLGALNYFLGISADCTPTESKLGPEGVPFSRFAFICMIRGSRTLLHSNISCNMFGGLFPSTRSAEAEYRGVANVVAETAWIRNLLRELHSPLSTATLVYCDSVSVVYMPANPVQHQRTKHIEIDIHFVRDMVTAGHVRVLHVSSRFQYANIFTKGLPTASFEDFCSRLSVRPPAQTAGAY
ncbi:ribonuclease H-like domain-containing protein, partial [Tanacetum coccineum]